MSTFVVRRQRGRPTRSVRATALLGVVISLLVSTALVTSCSSTPREFSGLRRSEPLDVSMVSLPDVTLRTGVDRMTLRAPESEWLTVSFGYTQCPDVCPTTLSDWRAALRTLSPRDRERFTYVFITVDPQRDSARILNNYVGSFVDRFRVLRTADFDELRRAQEPFLATSSVDVNDDGATVVSHTATTYVVDDAGRVVLEWLFGSGSNVMAADAQLLISNHTTTKGRDT